MKLTGKETGLFNLSETPVVVDSEFSKARGGTELMRERLFEFVPHDILNQFNIHHLIRKLKNNIKLK